MEGSYVVAKEGTEPRRCDRFAFFVFVRAPACVGCPCCSGFPVEPFVINIVHICETTADPVLCPCAFFYHSGHCLDVLLTPVVAVDVAPGLTLDAYCSVLVANHNHDKIIVTYEQYRAVQKMLQGESRLPGEDRSDQEAG